MLSIDMIRRDPEGVREALLKRLPEVDLESILELDRLAGALQREVDGMRAERTQLSKQIGPMRGRGEDIGALAARVAAIKAALPEAEAREKAARAELAERMDVLPNLPAPYVPAGGKEANQVVKVWGEKPPHLPAGMDHVAMCEHLGLVDFSRGVKLGGSGSWVYVGKGAALEWALLNFFCSEHYRDGYTFMLPPHMLLPECGYAAGQFPKFRDDVYHIAQESSDRGLFLLPTSETAILNYHRDEILEAGQLPLKAFAFTPCYRREAGAYRSEERGTIRGHQFNKVEMFQFVAPEDGERALAELVRKVESLMEKLGLHYRTSLLAAGDASASMKVTYDVEVWLPSIGVYKEVSSASWAGDYQARRSKIRYRPEHGQKARLVHTLNASGLATSRVFPAILEQCQQPDGSLRVPEPLQAWVGTDVIRAG
ncbi:MAG: serine--tRNA ligase [Pseudomonadota bacterium]